MRVPSYASREKIAKRQDVVPNAVFPIFNFFVVAFPMLPTLQCANKQDEPNAPDKHVWGRFEGIWMCTTKSNMLEDPADYS